MAAKDTDTPEDIATKDTEDTKPLGNGNGPPPPPPPPAKSSYSLRSRLVKGLGIRNKQKALLEQLEAARLEKEKQEKKELEEEKERKMKILEIENKEAEKKTNEIEVKDEKPIPTYCETLTTLFRKATSDQKDLIGQGDMWFIRAAAATGAEKGGMTLNELIAFKKAISAFPSEIFEMIKRRSEIKDELDGLEKKVEAEIAHLTRSLSQDSIYTQSTPTMTPARKVKENPAMPPKPKVTVEEKSSNEEDKISEVGDISAEGESSPDEKEGK